MFFSKFMSIIFTAIIFTAIINLHIPLVSSYSHGAPTRACSTLLPNHGADKQYGVAPYEITASEGTNGNILVTLMAVSDEHFAGFLMQARMAGDREKTVNGRFFEDKQSQTKACQSDVQNTLTHRSSTPKFKVEASWSPPKGFTGSVVFRATIVQSKAVFWTAQDSQPISISKVGNKISFGGITHYATSTNANGNDQLSSASSERNSRLNYAHCDHKMCFGLPEDCVSSFTCKMLLMGSQSPEGNVEFEIYADIGKDKSEKPENKNIGRNNLKRQPSIKTSRWFSMALSDDDKMGDDSVTDCVMSHSGRITIRNSVNIGKKNEPLLINEYHSVTPINTSVIDSVVHCKWKRQRRSTIRDNQFDLLNRQYHILLAMGEFDDDTNVKNYHEDKLASEDSIDLAQVGVVRGSGRIVWIRIHGSLMVITWLCLISISILMARHYKQVWISHEWCGVKIWFACHRTLMYISISLMAISTYCIFHYVGGYQSGPHQTFGSIALVLALIQPIIAFARPNPLADTRWIFNWVHFVIGNSSHIAAITAIFLAANLKSIQLPEAFSWLLMVYVAVYVSSQCLMQFHACLMYNKSKKTADISMRNIPSADSALAHFEKDPHGSGFRRFFLGIYVIMICAILIALLACINLPKMSQFING